MEYSLWFLLNYGTRWCAQQIPPSDFSALTSALVCATTIKAGRTKQLFVDTGLIHLLIVSGAHLFFVERAIFWLPARARLWIILFYGWLTGFGAPVIRALMRRILNRPLRLWGWTTLQSEAAVTTLLLLLHPPWLISRSFLMSWLCALALRAPPRWRRWPSLQAAIKCYLVLWPFIAPSPLVILWNALVSPAIGAVLFPACWLSTIVPGFTAVTDLLWQNLIWLLALGPKAPPAAVFISTNWLWWIPPITHILLLLGEWRWRRALAFLS